MAVATAHRTRPDRVAKDRFVHSRGRDDHLFGKQMSFPGPPQPPGAIEHIPINSPLVEDKFVVPQGGVDRESLRKRKASKSRPNDLRRSTSTPHLGKAVLPETGVMSPNDKKRNKLGYHRSSIACSHCRRRKIRCQLPLPEDAQGRCTNCIRLKKECNFYPVDQAPPVDNKPSATRRDTSMSGAPTVSSQSSPHVSGASQPSSVADEAMQAHLHSPQVDPSRQHREVGGFGIAASNEGRLHEPQMRPSVSLTTSAGHVPGVDFRFAPQSGSSWAGQQPPSNQYVPQQRASVAESQYWSSNNTPTSAHYSHEPSGPFSATTPNTFNSPNLAYTQGGNQFSAPARAMSFSHVEGVSHQFPYSNVQYGHQEPHPGFTLQSQPQFSPGTFPPHTPGNVHTQNVAQDGVPRTWSSAPSTQSPMVVSHQYPPQNLPSQYYAPQQPHVGVYDPRSQSSYPNHAQYYTPASNPG